MKKRVLCTLLCLMLALSLTAVAVMAAPEGPQITLQPQNIYYPEYSVASYTVKATGSNLRAFWYLEWQGKTYNLSDNTNGIEPWEGYAGENYGGVQDGNTFTWFFSGIEEELNGGYIWCVVEDGHFDVQSQKAMICVGDYESNPEILDIPTQLTVAQGQEAQLRCVAKSRDGSQLSYVWYETDTGKLEDMRAVDRGAETSDFIFCDTSAVGTRNYLCMVTTSNGGMAYSSIVPVTVTAAQTVDEMIIETKTLPEGVAGQPYRAQLKCNDPSGSFQEYYNPGKANDFGKTGLTLSADGSIVGTAPAAGSYSFCICAAGDSGEDYMVYTLVIREAEPTEPATEPVESSVPTEPATEPDTEPTTVPATEGAQPAADKGKENGGSKILIYALIGLTAASAAVVVTVLVYKKKS